MYIIPKFFIVKIFFFEKWPFEASKFVNVKIFYSIAHHCLISNIIILIVQ